MNRKSFLSSAALGVLLAASGGGAALADGTVSITNSTIDQPVSVEVRVGNTMSDAVVAGSQVLKKGETANFGPTNMRSFWHREADPGTNDGKWTDWVAVDSRNGDQHVTF